ncbi:MAG: acireductone synthase [Planctomycetes bacterium]|nr:acireductone synthase [Planctomycetota bacterium]
MSQTAVLLDIEGTTTSISFVFDVLFPYVTANVAGFLAAHRADPDVQRALELVRADATSEERGLASDEQALAVVRRQMAGDVKATGLKQLQGLIWKHGYEQGAIKGHLYADVPDCFANWRRAGRAIAIYSSGSRLAQQLLFRHSAAGDLTPHLDGYYDTTSGPKREAASYTTIATAWQRPAQSITFCTDMPAEATAAAAAGMNAVVLMRPGNAPLPAHLAFPVHADLTKV